jgi:hypothetical protein
MVSQYSPSADTLNDVVSQYHMVSVTACEGLIIKEFLLLAVVVSLSDSVRYWTDDISIPTIFYPRVQADLHLFGMPPLRSIGGEERSVWGVVVYSQLRHSVGAMVLNTVDEAAHSLVHLPFIPGTVTGN